MNVSCSISDSTETRSWFLWDDTVVDSGFAWVINYHLIEISSSLIIIIYHWRKYNWNAISIWKIYEVYCYYIIKHIFNNWSPKARCMITSLYSLSRRRSEYRLVTTEPEATNCFSINFQVLTNNNQHNFIKFTSNLLLYKKDKKQKAIVTDRSISLHRQLILINQNAGKSIVTSKFILIANSCLEEAN